MQQALRTRWNQARAALVAPRDIASLAAFRVAFGLIVVASSLRFLAYGWIDDMFVMPQFRFAYWGFGWVPAPSPGGHLRAVRGARACWARWSPWGSGSAPRSPSCSWCSRTCSSSTSPTT